jgi:hypothetical protein
MSALYVPFKSIEEIKERGEFIPKGRIYPVRMIKAANRKIQSKVVSGSNQWAIPTPSGYILFVENDDGQFSSVLHTKTNFKSNWGIKLSVYSGSDCCIYFVGNSKISDDEALIDFNKRFLSLCCIGSGAKDDSKQFQVKIDYEKSLNES